MFRARETGNLYDKVNRSCKKDDGDWSGEKSTGRGRVSIQSRIYSDGDPSGVTRGVTPSSGTRGHDAVGS